MEAKQTVSQKRNYLVTDVSQAKTITLTWLSNIELQNVISLGLPEVDDRYHIWRVPLLAYSSGQRIGECVINAYTTAIDSEKSTRTKMLEARLLMKETDQVPKSKEKPRYKVSQLRNTIGLGNSIDLIEQMPADSIDLVFTSPPYFNARPEYSEYEEYEQYLFQMRQVIKRCHRVIGEGRFFVINCSPVLLRRASRSQSSKRIAVPFDLHRIFIEEGYDFIDDIIWEKPAGAGWATGRGRRFAADRNPLQYKAVPVTEYVLVYRKQSDRLIDWHIRNHPDSEQLEDSKVGDDYERTNIWRISPKTNSKHPAAFPLQLAQKVVQYYSFKGDVVLDPFAGSGTVGKASAGLGRRFVLFEINPEYVDLMRSDLGSWDESATRDVLFLGDQSRSTFYQPHLLGENGND